MPSYHIGESILIRLIRDVCKLMIAPVAILYKDE